MALKFAESKVNGPHYQLSRLVGDWEGRAKTWFEPGKLGDESPVQGSMRPVLGGRFILHEYKGSMGGEALEGMVIIGYHLALGRYQTVLIDSFHSGSAIMFSEAAKGTTDMNVMGSYVYVTPEGEQYWGWRTIIELVNDDEILITAYNISPDGEEFKATETHYKRLK